MKYQGKLYGIPIYSSPFVSPDTLYLWNDEDVYFNYPKRKDGKYDMRYRVNKVGKLLGTIK